MAAFFGIVGLWPLLSGGPMRLPSLIVASLFAIAAFVAPRTLAPLNRIWARLGALMHAIVSPLALGAVFFLAVLPIGLLMRLLGKRPLALGFDTRKTSYWVPRSPPGPDPQSFTNQF